MTRPLRVLLVEDSQDDADLVLYELDRAGFVPTWQRVQSATEMAGALAESSWDVVLSDYSMPCFSADEALRLLREGGYDVPFIIISGTVGEERAVAMMRSGANDYLLKGNLKRLVPALEKELREAENRRARRAAEQSTRQLAAIIESCDDAIIATRLDGAIISWNAGATRLYGYPAVEVLGRPVYLLAPPGREGEVRDTLDRIAQGQAVAPFETVRRHQDGRLIPVSLTISPIRDAHGTLTGASAIARDLTQRKLLEEQLRQAQKMEAVGQLAGGIAHDFNNLLTVINGFSEMLLSQMTATDPSREVLRLIHGSGERAAILTRQLLAFSRKQVLAPVLLDLKSLIMELDKLLRRLIGAHIDLLTVLRPDLGRVLADPGQVEQVILNLAVNARDAMPGGGRLTIEAQNVELDDAYARTRREVRPGEYVMLAVSDTGCGMTPEVQARAFEPFFTTKEPGKGTGLGLATVYGIMKQSQGHVEVYSEVGCGTSFKLYFPRIAEPAAGRASDSVEFKIPRGQETVLLAEDDDGVRSLAQLILAAAGYRVLEARNGTDALRVAEQYAGPIHLLVTDVVMPGLGGRQLAERLATVRPGLRALFLSGYTDEAMTRQGILEGGMPFLQKPFTTVGLARKVREVLDTH